MYYVQSKMEERSLRMKESSKKHERENSGWSA